MAKILGIIGCFAAFAGVAMGAFGAHALKDRLVEAGTLEVWKTAVDYQFWHALALVLCGLIQSKCRARDVAGVLYVVGIVLFSGSLYWLALDGPRWLGPITPLGGLSFMLGWCALAFAFWQATANDG